MESRTPPIDVSLVVPVYNSAGTLRILLGQIHAALAGREALDPRARRVSVRLPTIPPDCDSSYHMFYVILPEPDLLTRLIAYLKSCDILAVSHDLPLHLSEMGRRWGGQAGDCPVSESISDRLVRLPFYTDITVQEQETVI